MIRTVITGTGSYIPEKRINNTDFLKHKFYENDGKRSGKTNDEIIEKFFAITGIEERRYARADQRASDLGFLAASDALRTSGIDQESLDYIVVAHNFGDIDAERNRVSIVPSLASRIKALLQIRNPDTVAYDLPFGCAGWLEAVIQADYFIRSGDATRCLVIGTETLSRVIDPADRDSMIFSDGSGAVILEAARGNKGIRSHKTQTHAYAHANLLNMGRSYAPDPDKDDIFIKMNGRKVYEFALEHVPLVIKTALDKAELHARDIDKILIHQANEKMDTAIVSRLLKLYGINTFDAALMPMNIRWLGNSSVATIPTLLDMILKDRLDEHKIASGDVVLFASVGAGMNINAVVYQF